MAAPSNGAAGPTSQIPGLSQSASDSAPAERHSGRRVGIFATDSDYVKLAKQGGQKGEGKEVCVYFANGKHKFAERLETLARCEAASTFKTF